MRPQPQACRSWSGRGQRKKPRARTQASLSILLNLLIFPKYMPKYLRKIPACFLAGAGLRRIDPLHLLQGFLEHSPDGTIVFRHNLQDFFMRSEERRVGKECRYRWSALP